MSGWVLFVFDLLVTGLVCIAYTQAARLGRHLLRRGGSGGSGGQMPWRYSPFQPGGGGPHAHAPRRRPPQRGNRTGRPARRSPPVA